MKTFICILTVLLATGYSHMFAQEKTPDSTKFEKIDKNGIYLAPEQMAEFPGGTEALLQYLAKNIKYPAEAQQKGYQGRVIVRVVINKKGRPENATVMRSVHPLLDAEALRVISTMPQWTPAKEKDKNVPAWITIPIMFNLTGPSRPQADEGSFALRASGYKVTNTSLAGVWQLCSQAIKDNEGTYHIKTLPFLKIISANHTFTNILMKVGSASSSITAQGSYEQPTDNVYVESIDQAGNMSLPPGSQNLINLEFLHDNLVRFSFKVPSIDNNKWVEEFWIRIVPPNLYR